MKNPVVWLRELKEEQLWSNFDMILVGIEVMILAIPMIGFYMVLRIIHKVF